MTNPGQHVRISDLPSDIADALTRPARPGELEELHRHIAEQQEPAFVEPPTQTHEFLNADELAQQQRDAGLYPTLDQQIDNLIDEYGGRPPTDVLRDVIADHKARLHDRMSTD